MRKKWKIKIDLEIIALRGDPFADELLRILRKCQIKFALSFQLIYLLDGIVNFLIQRRNFGLILLGNQKFMHLLFDRIVNFNLNVVTSCFLRFQLINAKRKFNKKIAKFYQNSTKLRNFFKLK